MENYLKISLKDPERNLVDFAIVKATDESLVYGTITAFGIRGYKDWSKFTIDIEEAN